MKVFLPIGILMVAFVLTWFTCSRYLTIELSLRQAFESTVQRPPALSVQVNGVDGGRAIIGWSFANVGKDTRTLQFGENSSERLVLTARNLNEIRTNLSNLDPQKWEILTKLPSPIFRFNLYLVSENNSPNNAKKASHFLVTNVSSGTMQRALPGETIVLARDLQVDDITRTLTTSKLDLVYNQGMYMNFFNKHGEFISQATGAIVVRPTFFTQASVFISIWFVLLALIFLVKKTLLLSKDFEEVKSHYGR